jgi:hypothetical protein
VSWVPVFAGRYLCQTLAYPPMSLRDTHTWPISTDKDSKRTGLTGPRYASLFGGAWWWIGVDSPV